MSYTEKIVEATLENDKQAQANTILAQAYFEAGKLDCEQELRLTMQRISRGNSGIVLIEMLTDYRDSVGTVEAWLPGESEMDDDVVASVLEAGLAWLEEQ